MSDEEKRIVEVATNFVKTILSKNINIDSANELYEINNGNKDVILEHLVAINKITKKAIEILGVKDER